MMADDIRAYMTLCDERLIRITELEAELEEANTVWAELREISTCVLRGWTHPAFVRGPLHERAVEIAHRARERALKEAL